MCYSIKQRGLSADTEEKVGRNGEGCVTSTGTQELILQAYPTDILGSMNYAAKCTHIVQSASSMMYTRGELISVQFLHSLTHIVGHLHFRFRQYMNQGITWSAAVILKNSVSQSFKMTVRLDTVCTSDNRRSTIQDTNTPGSQLTSPMQNSSVSPNCLITIAFKHKLLYKLSLPWNCPGRTVPLTVMHRGTCWPVPCIVR